MATTSRDELHRLVDSLSDDDLDAARRLLRALDSTEATAELDDGAELGRGRAALTSKMGPGLVPGKVFLRGTARSEAGGAAGPPPADITTWRPDFWPEDESVDDFIAAVREWRAEGRRGGSSRRRH